MSKTEKSDRLKANVIMGLGELLAALDNMEKGVDKCLVMNYRTIHDNIEENYGDVDMYLSAMVKHRMLISDIVGILAEYEDEKEDHDVISTMLMDKVESLGLSATKSYPEHPVDVEFIKQLMEAVKEHLGIGIDTVERYVINSKENK